MFILNNLYYGDNFFDIVDFLRNSMFLSVLLGHCEIWPNVTTQNLKSLEACDNKFLTQVMGISPKGSYSLMLLEGGLLPIKHIIISRRLNYLHNLLKSDPSSFAKQVFIEQQKTPKRQDWTSQILKDLSELEISLSFDEIIKFPHTNF